MMTASRTGVAEQAQRMLDAWRRSDFAAFRERQAAPAGECEFQELLDGVTAEMRSASESIGRNEPVAAARIGACLKLLAHLSDPRRVC